MRRQFALLYLVGVIVGMIVGVSSIVLASCGHSNSWGRNAIYAKGSTSSLHLPALRQGEVLPTATENNHHATIPIPATSTPAATITPSATTPPMPTVTTTQSPVASVTSTATGTSTPTPVAVATSTPTPTATGANTPTPTPTGTSTPTPTATATSTPTPTLTGTSTPTPTATATSTSTLAYESFEGEPATWQIVADVTGSGTVAKSTTHVLAGSFAARATVADNLSTAQIRGNISDPATSHTWGERPGTWHWQRANIFVPLATVQQLGQDEYIDLAGFWSSSNGYGWWLRLKAGGALSVYGFDSDGRTGQFSIYSQFPLDRWVEVEIGLHSQAGPGVQRAFAVLLDGNFYGWYHQGRLPETDYDRVAMGILATNSTTPLELFIDQWDAAGSDPLPTGPDYRSTAEVQEQDFRTQSGVQWQIDWSTWQNKLTLHAQYGLYSATDRLQSGRNLDRMPNLASGWAEIELDWPQGTPPANPNGYFGPMVGFRKEINREENLEVILIGSGDGAINLVLEAWIGSPVILAQWPLPAASFSGETHIPEPGDIIRTRWEQISPSDIRVWASYYDASAQSWHNNVIDHTLNGSQIGTSQFGPVDYNDGYHTAASITIDSSYYSIRRFQVGTPATYP